MGVRLKIIDLELIGDGYSEILSEIIDRISNGKHFSFANVNAYISLYAKHSLSLKKDLQTFSKLYSDGIGVYWASRFLYGRNGISQRINGTDLYYKILELAQRRNYSVYFFGGGEEAMSVLQESLLKQFPNLIIKGITGRDIPFDESILEKLNHSYSDILFLGLGTPYQEKWIADFSQKCNITVKIAVGSGIDFLAGTNKRAPNFLRKVGLEWFFRLLLEPKRLWQRYLIGIPHFIILIIKQKLFR